MSVTDWGEAEVPFRCPWFRVERTGTWHRVVNADGAVAVPVLPDGRLLFVEMHRHATSRLSLELPRGGSLKGEGAVETACREMEEETGHAPVRDRSRGIGAFHPDQGVLSGAVRVVNVPVSAATLSARDEEAIRVLAVHPESAWGMIGDGRICCGITIAAISLWWFRVGESEGCKRVRS